MNKKFNIIINVCIIILIIALVYVMMSYYTGMNSYIPTQVNNTNVESSDIEDFINAQNSGENSGEIADNDKTENNKEDIKPPETVLKPSGDNNNDTEINKEDKVSRRRK